VRFHAAKLRKSPNTFYRAGASIYFALAVVVAAAGGLGGGSGFVIPEVAVTHPLGATFLGLGDVEPGFSNGNVLGVLRGAIAYSFAGVA
jgi:hypothetical protein